MKRVLLTTTSYQDTPGAHHAKLEEQGYEIIRARGPLSEAGLLERVGEVDALLCGDDAITRAVIDKALPRLKLISKYGIGLDKIDMGYATEKGIPVTFCPGVNHTTVAEHTFALLLSIVRHLVEEVNATRKGEWKRMTGHEIMGKTLGIIGLGRIGREVAIRGKAFGLHLIGYDLYWPDAFASEYGIEREEGVDDVLRKADIVSLHTNLTEETRNMISKRTLSLMKDGAILLNCARGELVDSEAVVAALEVKKLGGYGTDVLDCEPPPPDHILLKAPHCLVTPHIGSRTYESVQRQAMMATENLILGLNGEKPLAQANEVPIKRETDD